MSQAVLSRYIQPDVLTRVEKYQFAPQQLVEGTLAGAHKSPFHGFAVEFAGHREYVPGDDLRHLDWRVYFRNDRHVGISVSAVAVTEPMSDHDSRMSPIR